MRLIEREVFIVGVGMTMAKENLLQESGYRFLWVENSTCALDENYEISCWGVNDVGQTDVPTGTYIKISSGIEHACALTLDNNVECWGQISEVYKVIYNRENIDVLYANGDLECWGASGSNLLNVDVDEDGSSVLLDCNDDRSDLYPQDLDADGYSPCDGDCDDTTSAIGYVDADGDGFACLLDCDDTSASKNGNDVMVMGLVPVKRIATIITHWSIQQMQTVMDTLFVMEIVVMMTPQ